MHSRAAGGAGVGGGGNSTWTYAREHFFRLIFLTAMILSLIYTHCKGQPVQFSYYSVYSIKEFLFYSTFCILSLGLSISQRVEGISVGCSIDQQEISTIFSLFLHGAYCDRRLQAFGFTTTGNLISFSAPASKPNLQYHFYCCYHLMVFSDLTSTLSS